MNSAGEQFNRQAARYAVSEAHASGASLRILTAWASLERYTMGLDIATGPGFTAFAVAEFCDTIVASDIARRMLDQARIIAGERSVDNVRFEIVDACDISYPDASLDLVTCRTAPHHFTDVGRFLSEVHRVLSPGGVFLLCDTTTSEDPEVAAWHHRVEVERDPTHVTAQTPSGWRRDVTDAGFEISHTANTRVDMTFQEWVERSGTPAAAQVGLYREFAAAFRGVRSEFGIRRLGEDDFEFYWPVFCCRSVKTQCP
ncbi:MAG: class I SAM-dependent methyltransferase [Candidatus Latescibacteria bacterium]|nr:class I SAM-dependent methyltransferase [Candidatus Latescibacterota bacterium]